MRCKKPEKDTEPLPDNFTEDVVWSFFPFPFNIARQIGLSG